METSTYNSLCTFLKTEEALAEKRLHQLTELLLLQQTSAAPPPPSVEGAAPSSSTASSFSPSILEHLLQMRQHAEEDLSSILHLQSVVRGPQARKPRTKPDLQLVPSIAALEGQIVDGGLEVGDVEVAVAATDDLFLMEGLEDSRSPQSLTFSDDDRDDSELDEGIHIPRRRTNKEPLQVAASHPVGIPWTTGGPAPNGEAGGHRPGHNNQEEEDRPTDIAASIKMLARSVHTSSVFGDLPKARTVTLANK